MMARAAAIAPIRLNTTMDMKRSVKIVRTSIEVAMVMAVVYAFLTRIAL